eukprot:3441071-Rhodomonas_salina.1
MLLDLATRCLLCDACIAVPREGIAGPSKWANGPMRVAGRRKEGKEVTGARGARRRCRTWRG